MKWVWAPLGGTSPQSGTDDLSGVRTHRHQGMVSQLSGVPIRGAVFGLGGHLTDSGIHIQGDRVVVGTSTRRPDPSEDSFQGFVHLADMTPRERTKERPQRGRGHHLKRQHPLGGPGPVAARHDRYENRPPASTPPGTTPSDPDGHRRPGRPSVRSRPTVPPTQGGT